jgi:hypothetical protein
MESFHRDLASAIANMEKKILGNLMNNESEPSIENQDRPPKSEKLDNPVPVPIPVDSKTNPFKTGSNGDGDGRAKDFRPAAVSPSRPSTSTPLSTPIPGTPTGRSIVDIVVSSPSFIVRFC